MAVEHIWVGAITSSSAYVRGKVSGSSVRLAVSVNPDLSSPTYFGPVSPSLNIASITATSLSADTQYYYAFEVDSSIDTDFTGKFKTHGTVGEPYSFTFAAAGDAGNSQTDVLGNTSPYIVDRISNRPIFDTIRQRDPQFFVHLGDLHYVDITSGDEADYRTAFDDTLTFNGTEGADARQGKLYRNVPLVYIWDDHDYSNNNSDGSYSGKQAAGNAYRERVPSYTLPDDYACYHEFQIGRVQFILTDSRYYRDSSGTPTMLGSAQMTWLEGVLQNSDSEFLVFCTQVQWMSDSSDSWGGFTAERDTIAGWLETYEWTDRMIMLNADKHSLGLDTGTNNEWGGFPVYLLASLDCGGGDNTGPYDLGITGGRDRYGMIEVTDTGDQITVTTTGYVELAPYASHTVTVDLSTTAPSSGTDPILEIKVGDVWTDISSYVYQRDKVQITRGRADETSTTQPGTCKFTVNNADGRFSPRNPNSPYYGLIGRNTPIRVSVVRNSVQYYRFYGEVSAWPMKWDTSGNDVYVQIQAGGLLRRLGQGNNPIRSTLTRELIKPSRSTIAAYWPMEDEGGSFSSGHPGESPIRIQSGTPGFRSYSDFDASDSLPTMKDAKLIGTVPTYTDLGQISVRFFTFTPEALSSSSNNIVRLTCNGSIRYWDFIQDDEGDLIVHGVSNSGSTVYDSGVMAFDLIDRPCVLTFEISQNGSDVDVAWIRTEVSNDYLYNVSGSSVEITDTISSHTIGQALTVEINRDASLGDVVIGQFAVARDLTAFANSAGPLGAYNDEASTIRFKRLCDEEGITREVIFSDMYAGNSTRLGTQKPKTLVDLFNEIEAHNHGMLYESRSQLGLGYRDRLSLYNQDAAITLDYSNGDLAPDFEPLPDDQGVTNDVTVTRDGGASARYEVTTGPLSTAPPPDGVGRYDTQATLSLAFDYYAYPQAGWLAHLGTVDEERYPQVTIDLSMEPYTSSTSKTAAVLGLDVGDRIVITGLPDWLPPGDITLMIQGYSETLDPYQPMITFNCTPETPWHVGAIGDATYSRLGSSGSTVDLAMSNSVTTMKVASEVLWTTDDDLTPFDVVVGGEQMTVTDISGSSSPQTFTVTRSVNGIVKTHEVGETVTLATPVVTAL